MATSFLEEKKLIDLLSTLQVAVVWAGAQTTNTIKTTERTCGLEVKSNVRGDDVSLRIGGISATGLKDSR